MIKIDIISGFLGAGKTTLIKKLLEEGFKGERVVLIENEFGEVGIDGILLKNYGIEIKEMNSGCICCTIAGDFSLALKEVLKLYHPDRILIEPSGVGKLSDVIGGCKPFLKENVTLNICMAVVDGMKYKMYSKNFSEFYKDQIMNAKTVILSRTQSMTEDMLTGVLTDIRTYYPGPVITTEWSRLTGGRIVEIAQEKTGDRLAEDLKLDVKNRYRINRTAVLNKTGKAILKKHESSHPAGHPADEVFRVWGMETVKSYSRNQLTALLMQLKDQEGTVLRAKGMVPSEDGVWLQFDYVPEEFTIRETAPDYTGRICVIGESINQMELNILFNGNSKIHNT